jgi:hypothetical protein
MKRHHRSPGPVLVRHLRRCRQLLLLRRVDGGAWLLLRRFPLSLLCLTYKYQSDLCGIGWEERFEQLSYVMYLKGQELCL